MEVNATNYRSCCRVCISVWDNLHDLFTTYIGDSQLSSLLSRCIDGMNVCIDDGLPSAICSKCRANLEIAYNFRELCRESEDKLQRIAQAIDNGMCDDDDNKLTIIKNEQPDFVESEIFAENLSMDIDERFDSEDCGDSADAATDFNAATEFNAAAATNARDMGNSEYAASAKLFGSSNVRRTIHSRKYPCPSCEKIFTNKSNLNRHLKSKLASELQPDELRQEESFRCLQCDKEFPRQTLLLLHLQTHETFLDEPQTFDCELCSKTFQKACNLGKHMQSHVNARRFTCKVCNRVYTGVNIINLHLNKHERSRKANQINEKSNKFKMESDAAMDGDNTDSIVEAQRTTAPSIKTVNPIEARPKSKYIIVNEGDRVFYLCPTCPNRYANSSNLNRHIKDKSIIKSYQTNERPLHSNSPFKCFKCSERFVNQNQLIVHLKACTMTNSTEDKVQIECDHCPKLFAKSFFLRKHLRIHEKLLQVYHCSICNYQFKAVSLLSHHLHIAHREQVYVCPVCYKGM